MKLSEKMREYETGEMDRWADEASQLEAELDGYKAGAEVENTLIALLEAENAALKREIKALPDKLKWISDNASHKVAPHWLRTQLYGLAREIETGHFSVGTKDYHKVDTLADTQESE